MHLSNQPARFKEEPIWLWVSRTHLIFQDELLLPTPPTDSLLDIAATTTICITATASICFIDAPITSVSSG